MLMSSAYAWEQAFKMKGKEGVCSTSLCCRSRLSGAAINLSYAPCVVPYRRTGKFFTQQGTRRSHGVAIGNEGGKATGGISTIGPVEPDFIAWHDHPIHGLGHVRSRASGLHCAMLTVWDSFSRRRKHKTFGAREFVAGRKQNCKAAACLTGSRAWQHDWPGRRR